MEVHAQQGCEVTKGLELGQWGVADTEVGEALHGRRGSDVLEEALRHLG
jgi:hypothetical protein